MPIITHVADYATPDFALLNLYPDQFVSESKKESDSWIKTNMDYFYSIAVNTYVENKHKFVKNYELLAGILRKSDFYEEPKLRSFVETLIENEELPSYVKHYCILTPPINTLKGELSNRPDNVYVKAFDEDSKSEENQFRTNLIQDFIYQSAKQRMVTLLASKGQEIESEEELDTLTAEKVNEYMVSYTSLAERWGSNILEYLKMAFSMKEKAEEGFGDLLICAREHYHIYEDNTELGFNIAVMNPKNVWYVKTPDNKYISNPLDKTSGAYAAGTMEIMELSEVIHKFQLTTEEVNHLRKMSQQNYLISDRPSNLVNPNAPTGPQSIHYNTYDPAVLQYRQMIEADMMSGDESGDLFSITNNVGTFGNKYVVIRAYWCSKKKLGKLTYIDSEGIEQITYVDDNYKKGSHPQEVSLEWGWINQWYQGVKIGLDVYYVKPFELLDYCPIIGVLFEPKNLPEPVSLVDKMKNYQMLYNICMNQLFRLLEKDLGVVFLMNARHVPTPRDGDPQDALELWEEEAREKGFIFIDDSPENLQGASSFNQFTRADLSRANEIQARYNLAVELRNECWRLVGLSEQRLGSTAASETATGINTALSQSYAQTEVYFSQHEYLMNKVYQALLDAALYKQSQTEENILASLSSEGTNQFVKVNGADLKLRNLGVFVTSRSEDNRNFQEIRNLAQAMLQNGASPYEISLLYSTKSIRQVKETFKKLKEKTDAFQQEQQNIEKAKIEQAQEQFQQAQQLAQLQDEKNKAFEAYQAEEDRLSRERVALIQASSNPSSTSPPDQSIDISRLALDEQNAYSQYQLKLQELTQKQQAILSSNALAAKKLDVEKYKADMTLKVAKENKVGERPKPKKK